VAGAFWVHAELSHLEHMDKLKEMDAARIEAHDRAVRDASTGAAPYAGARGQQQQLR
jgi:hypothetical protein